MRDSPIRRVFPTTDLEPASAAKDAREAVEKAWRSHSPKLINNAEEIRKIIREGAEMGVQTLTIKCTKEVGAGLNVGFPLPMGNVGVEIKGRNDGNVEITVTYK
jgi:hypothetical protein